MCEGPKDPTWSFANLEKKPVWQGQSEREVQEEAVERGQALNHGKKFEFHLKHKKKKKKFTQATV